MKRKSLGHLIPLITLFLLFLLFLHFDLQGYLNFDFLREQRAVLDLWIKKHYVLAPLAFSGIFIISVAIAIPAALILKVAAGFLFGFPLGAIYVLFSSTIGASLLFLSVKLAFCNLLNQKTNKWKDKLQLGFQQNPFLYLIILRIIPIFPFFIINIVAGALNVKTRTFIYATLLGGIPCTVIYTLIGNSLGQIINQNQSLSLNLIFTPNLLILFFILACLCLLPVFFKTVFLKKVSS